MKAVFLACLIFLFASSVFALSPECQTKIKAKINQTHGVDESSFSYVLFANFLLDNNNGQIWKYIGVKMVSVQYHHDTEFVEFMVKLDTYANDDCHISHVPDSVIRIIQHDQ